MIDTAIVLAAGLGTRLAPLSSVRAKAALPVGGEAIIRRQIRWLAAAGVRRVVVNLHHRPSTITEALGHGDDLGVEVRYSWERQVLGSAGGPRQALDLVDAERVIIVNGDTLTDLNLAALASEHQALGASVTLAAVPADLRRYSALLVSSNGSFTGVVRTGTAPEHIAAGNRPAHFIGVQVAERRAFAAAPPGEPSESIVWLYPALTTARPGAVRVWVTDASFHDIGTPADYLRTATSVAAAEGKLPDRGARVAIDPAATVERSVCWDDVRVGAGAHVVDCILADGVRVPAGLHVSRASVVRAAGVAPGPGSRMVGDLLIAPFDGG